MHHQRLLKQKRKIFLPPVLMLLTLILSLGFASFGAASWMSGDLNHDGRVDILDVVLVMRHILGLEELTAEQELAADVNRDGSVNVQDVSLIMQKTLALIDSFPFPNAALVKEFIVSDGIAFGKKIVVVTLAVDDVHLYQVKVGGRLLNFDEEQGYFFGEILAADAELSKVEVMGPAVGAP